MIIIAAGLFYWYCNCLGSNVSYLTIIMYNIILNMQILFLYVEYGLDCSEKQKGLPTFSIGAEMIFTLQLSYLVLEGQL